MLAVRPWSAYELTQQIRRSLSYCLPTVESVLYHEPKRLVRLGLVRAKRQAVANRTRTVYSITAQGRKVLGEWLATPLPPPRLEVPLMLRLLYADQASKEDLVEAISSARAWALDRAPDALAQTRGYLADGGPFPGRLHISALFARFYVDLFGAIIDWCDFADDQIQTWPDTANLGMTDQTRTLLEELEARLHVLADRAAEESGLEDVLLPSGLPARHDVEHPGTIG
jgi:DNA-binding PadR family transcriptional regulator